MTFKGSTVSSGTSNKLNSSLPRIPRIVANVSKKFVQIREIRG